MGGAGLKKVEGSDSKNHGNGNDSVYSGTFTSRVGNNATVVSTLSILEDPVGNPRAHIHP